MVILRNHETVEQRVFITALQLANCIYKADKRPVTVKVTCPLYLLAEPRRKDKIPDCVQAIFD